MHRNTGSGPSPGPGPSPGHDNDNRNDHVPGLPDTWRTLQSEHASIFIVPRAFNRLETCALLQQRALMLQQGAPPLTKLDPDQPFNEMTVAVTELLEGVLPLGVERHENTDIEPYLWPWDVSADTRGTHLSSADQQLDQKHIKHHTQTIEVDGTHRVPSGTTLVEPRGSLDVSR